MSETKLSEFLAEIIRLRLWNFLSNNSTYVVDFSDFSTVFRYCVLRFETVTILNLRNNAPLTF